MTAATKTREVERRYLTQPVEWRAAGDSAVGSLGGYAAVFNRLSQNLGGFVEEIDPAAFNKSLGDNVRVLCRYNHSDDQLLGTTDAGTLVLAIDDVGLEYVVALPDTSTGRDVAVLAQRKDLRNSSFAFICIEDEWGVTPQGFPVRRILQAQLIDVAPVVNPAYLDSTTGMRSLAAHLGMDVATVEAKPTEELRALLAGDAGTPAEDDAPPTIEGVVPATVDVETDSQTDSSEQRESHSVPASIRSRQMDLATKR